MPKKFKQDLVAVGVNLERSQVSDLDIIAKHYGVGRSAVIRWALLAYLSSHKDLTQDAGPNS